MLSLIVVISEIGGSILFGQGGSNGTNYTVDCCFY